MDLIWNGPNSALNQVKQSAESPTLRLFIQRGTAQVGPDQSLSANNYKIRENKVR